MLHWGTEYPIIVRSVKQIDSILKGFLMKKIIIVAIAFLFLSGCADKVILDPNSISDDIGFFLWTLAWLNYRVVTYHITV